MIGDYGFSGLAEQQVADRVKGAGSGNLQLLISAHASLEELFLIGKVGHALNVPEDGVAISWRTRVKPQPPRVKFTIPPIDAPNAQISIIAVANSRALPSASRPCVMCATIDRPIGNIIAVVAVLLIHIESAVQTAP